MTNFLKTPMSAGLTMILMIGCGENTWVILNDSLSNVRLWFIVWRRKLFRYVIHILWVTNYVVMQGCYRDYWVLPIGFAIETSKENKLTFPRSKGQLNSEWIFEVIVSPKMPTKHFSDFCPGSLLEGREIFGWHFGRNDDLINSFWI